MIFTFIWLIVWLLSSMPTNNSAWWVALVVCLLIDVLGGRD